MNRRLAGGDHSLNALVSRDGEGDVEWQDWLVEPSENADVRLGVAQEVDLRHRILTRAMDGLNPREREIITLRRLRENPATLEDLAQKFGISRERIRQIEVRAFEKLQKNVKIAAAQEGLLPDDLGATHSPARVLPATTH